MLPHHLRRVVLVIGAGTAIACASGGGTGGGSGNRAGTDDAKHDRTQITAADMKDIPASNLFEIVQRVHPEWLTVRNSVSIGSPGGRTAGDQGIHVYIDSQRAGSTEILKQISVSSAASLKFYSPSEAQARFGNGNLSGVIQVISVMKR